jgi:FkbM family methyltransferase
VLFFAAEDYAVFAGHLPVGARMPVYEKDGLRLHLNEDTAAADVLIIDEVQRAYAWDTPLAYALDVGAHIGAWTCVALRQYPAARIIAIEVDAQNAALLRQNTAHLPGVSCYEARCGYAPGAFSVARHRTNSGSTRVYPAAAPGSLALAAAYHAPYPAPPRLTPEQAVQAQGFPRLDVLKLDCEGAEIDILNGLSAALLAQVQQIVGEIHSPPAVFEQQTGQRLQRAGFRVTYTPHPVSPHLYHTLTARR